MTKYLYATDFENLITDRTSDDSKVNPDDNGYRKDYYNIDDWNRVMNLINQLSASGNISIVYTGDSWTGVKSFGDLVDYTDLTNMLKGAETIRTAWYTDSTTTKECSLAVWGTFDWQLANYVEQILQVKWVYWYKKQVETPRANRVYAGSGYYTTFTRHF